MKQTACFFSLQVKLAGLTSCIMRFSSISLLMLLCLSGCAKINDARMELLSSSSPSLAVVNDNLLAGKVVLFTDRTGTLNLESKSTQGLKCLGDLRFTASRSGVANLKCTDGTDISMTFNAIGETRGFGNGKTSRGPASFAFGFAPADAASYLNLPAGKRIITDAEGNSKIETVQN